MLYSAGRIPVKSIWVTIIRKRYGSEEIVVVNKIGVDDAALKTEWRLA